MTFFRSRLAAGWLVAAGAALSSPASMAQDLELGNYIRLGRGEESSGGRTRTSILADAVESVIAAMFLDGGMDVAERFILDRVLSVLRGEDE